MRESRAVAEEEQRRRYAFLEEAEAPKRGAQTAKQVAELPIIPVEIPHVAGKPVVGAVRLDYAVDVERKNLSAVPIAGISLLEKPRVPNAVVDYGVYIRRVAINQPVLVELPRSERPLVAANVIDYGVRVGGVEIPPPTPIELISTYAKPNVSASVDVTYAKLNVSAVAGAGAPPETLLELALEFKDAAGSPAGVWRLHNCEGTTLVVYPQGMPGLDESLAVLALELQRIICGKSHDPKFLDVDDLEMMRDEGVYVIRGGNSDRRDRVERVFGRFMGFAPKVVIVSEDLLANLRISSKPSSYVRIAPKSADALRLIATAYTGFAEASGATYCRYIRVGSYDVLALAKSCWYTEARRHLAWALSKAPHKLRPSVSGGESETHVLLKAMAIRHVAETLGVPIDSIKVEDEVRECGGAVPDLYFTHNGRRIAVDVKASIGVLPTYEIMEAAEKYSGCADEVWVLLRPIAFLAFTKPILKTLTHLQVGGRRVRVMLPLYDEVEGAYKMIEVDEFLKVFAERAKYLRKETEPRGAETT